MARRPSPPMPPSGIPPGCWPWSSGLSTPWYGLAFLYGLLAAGTATSTSSPSTAPTTAPPGQRGRRQVAIALWPADHAVPRAGVVGDPSAEPGDHPERGGCLPQTTYGKTPGRSPQV